MQLKCTPVTLSQRAPLPVARSLREETQRMSPGAGEGEGGREAATNVCAVRVYSCVRCGSCLTLSISFFFTSLSFVSVCCLILT